MNLPTYVRDIQAVHASGKATEHSYRESLRNLLASVQNGLTVVNEPKRIEVGAPDFIIERAGVPLGFVEAKNVDEDLDRLDKRSKKQLDDYRAALPNLIHTNYLHFRWYVGGQLVEDFSLGTLKNGKIEVQRERFDDIAGMLARFVEQVAPTISSPEELAKRMAAMTRQIATLINNSLPSSDTLKNQMAAFESTLIPGIKADEFADMYAQTLAYGLFAARVRYGAKSPEDFTLQNAFWNLPDTNPFLRRFFQEIAPELDDRVRWQAETLAALLAHAQMDDILRDFGRRTRTEDPVVHFYETFLREYDPAKREQRGVYYTPEPVVSYIVRSVDHLLRERFGRDGLADPQTLILDPATGTGTFLYFVIQHIYESMAGQKGMWNAYVRDHLLPRLFGFELLMAPYAVAHMKLGIQLQETGYTFTGGQRLGVYLTNTLEEMTKPGQQQFAQFINREANEAAEIKREKPIMVVLGNPPYSGHSANKGEWIDKLVRDYYRVDGKPLGERNPKWLQDDYVKFIRFGQWRINETHSGILAFVTNHGYLDNPTFRGMRQQLMSAFTDIYILNLHGNSKKKEKTPDGGKDENVFDIQQGVAIGIFVKQPHLLRSDHPHPPAPSPLHGEGELEVPLHEVGRDLGWGQARIHHADLYGLRDEKYETLLESDLSTTDWHTFTPQAPFYLFTPQNLDLKGEYEAGWKVTDAFPVNVLGFQTHRDHFAVDFDRNKLYQRIKDMRENHLSDDEYRQQYSVADNRDWQLANARKTVRNDQNWESKIIECAYRPFDNRPCYFSDVAMDYPRRELIQHIFGQQNLCLNTVRQTKMDLWQHILISDSPAPAVYVEIKDGSSVFPLYLYPKPAADKLFDAEGDWPPGKDGRVPNLNPKFIREMEAKLGLTFVPEPLPAAPPLARGGVGGGVNLEPADTFTPEDVFHYAYAVFHSPTYRERYAEFLKIDFPRLPLTSDKELFRALCEKGAALVDLHLLRGGNFQLQTTFPESGDNTVASGYPKHDEKTQRVYINKQQYFEGIASEVWGFHVGGYQVLEKWLKDRRGRALNYQDIMHYQRVVVALANTICLMSEIDDLIPAWPLT